MTSTPQPRPTDAEIADVVIVGCGPTGLVLSILLAQRGHRVVVLERWAQPYPLPRAVHFDHEVGRILQSCGVGAAVRGIVEPANVYEWRNGEGLTLLRFGGSGDAPSGWPGSCMFSQPVLEAILEERARELPTLELRRNVEVTDLEQHADHVVVRDAEGTVVRGRFAVGCDGARSTIRSLLGLDMVDLGYFYDWFIVDVMLHEPRVYDPVNLQVCDPTRPTTAVSGGPGRRRWEFMRLPEESPEDFNNEARAWELLEPWDVTQSNAVLERHAAYTFQARYAERWREGRVLLAGDAAHQTPPFAGQGMCAGIRDSANLAWKLDLVLRGAAPDDLLDAYTEERLPHVRRAIEFAIELGKVICVPDPVAAAERDRAMSATVTAEPVPTPGLPGLSAGCIDASTPYAGHLFVQGSVGGQLFDDAHGAGWRLLTTERRHGTLDADALTWFASIGGAVVTVDEPDPTYARWFGEHATSWALQRPDFYLVGTATDLAGADRLLAALRARLTTRTGTPVPEPTSQGAPA